MINQINQIGSMVSNSPSNTKKIGAVEVTDQFSNLLKQAVEGLNNQQQTVDNLNEQYVTGNLQDVHKLMIASEKATLGLDLAIQVRNKVVDAYNEIMRMQV